MTIESSSLRDRDRRETPAIDTVSLIRLVGRPTYLPSSLHMLYLLLEPYLQDSTCALGPSRRVSPRWRIFGSPPPPTDDTTSSDEVWGVAAINFRANQPRAHVWISSEAEQEPGGSVSDAEPNGENLLRHMLDEFFLPELKAHNSTDPNPSSLRMMFASINQCWTPELRRGGRELYYEGPCTKAAKRISVKEAQEQRTTLPAGFRIRNVEERDLQQASPSRTYERLAIEHLADLQSS